MKDIDGIEQMLDVLRPHWTEIEATFDRENERFKALMSADHEAIGRVLKAHLVIENFLNTFLENLFGINLKAVRLNFAQKAAVLPERGTSASFVRPGIMQLNEVRNKFGHRIDHTVERHHISAIYEVLEIARPGVQLDDPIGAIEAFAPVACAFLSVAPDGLKGEFLEAFDHVRGHNPQPA